VRLDAEVDRVEHEVLAVILRELVDDDAAHQSTP
jgi:hypothetical protein